MYWDEHAPPHFHAIYGEFKAIIDIRGLAIGQGSLPRRASQLVLDWAELHQRELLEDWDLCQIKQQPRGESARKSICVILNAVCNTLRAITWAKPPLRFVLTMR